MSGIQSFNNSIQSTTVVNTTKNVQKEAAPTKSDSGNITVSVSKDNISNLGKGLVAGAVPAAGVAIAIKLSGTAIEHMGDGGLGLGIALMGSKPAVAAALSGGAAAALIAPGKPLAGAATGVVTGAITGGALGFVAYKNPMIAAIGVVTGGIIGGVSGAAGSYITKK